ncbi:hypothetical protein EN797_039420, partial [Mesorhizobium sp. M2E.F.Ca.ET.154.01.1.1]
GRTGGGAGQRFDGCRFRLRGLAVDRLVNRGVLIAPFHNMMLVSPATTAAQVRRLITAFSAVAARLAA